GRGAGGSTMSCRFADRKRGWRRARGASPHPKPACNCLARLPPVFPRKSVVSSSTRGRFWAYEAVNPRFSPEKQGLDALNNYRRDFLDRPPGVLLRLVADEPPNVLVKRAELFLHHQERLGILDGSLDLQPVADDPGVRQQALALLL